MSKKLSPFIFSQQIYDYLTNQLSDDQKVKFEAKLNAEKDCQQQVAAIKKCLTFYEGSGQWTLSDLSVKSIKNFQSSPLFFLVNPAVSPWWPAVKNCFLWCFVALFFLLALVYIPWENFEPNVVNRQKKVKNYIQQPVVSSKKPDLSTNVMAVEKKPKTVDSSISNFSLPVKSDNNTGKKLALGPAVNSNNTQQTNAKELKGPPSKPKNSYLDHKVEKSLGPNKRFRFYMSLHDLDKQTLQIVSIIKSLNGEKGGAVKLGHIKPKGRYFHIKLPYVNKDLLLEKLRDLGVVRVNEENYSYRQKDESTRVILWVEDLDLKVKRLQNR